MRKKALLIPIMCVLLGSCGSNNNQNVDTLPDDVNQKDDKKDEKEPEGEKETDKPSSEDQENPQDNPGENPSEEDPKEDPVEEEFVVNDDTLVTTLAWDEKIEKVIDYALGDEHPVVPSYKTLKYEASISVVETTSGAPGIRVAEIKCFTSILSVAISNYEKQLTSGGYTLHSEYDYGYRMLNYVTDMCIEYSTVAKSDKNPEGYFLLRIYKVDMRVGAWLEDDIEYYVGASIPEFSAPSYYYDLDSYTFQLSILANFTEEGDMQKYVSKATMNGDYTLVTDTIYDYELLSSDKYVTIQLYETSTDYGARGVLIRITNAWPHIAVSALTGGELPKLRDVCENFSYTYVSNPSSYCLYYDASSLEEFEKYKGMLVDAGYTLENEEDDVSYSTNGAGEVVATYHNYYLTKTNADETTASLQLMFHEEGSTTALAIFE